MRLIDADALWVAIKPKLERMYGYEIRAVKEVIDNAPAVQREGWKLVPIEPDSNQINTGADELRQAIAMFNSGRSVQSAAIRTYKAMISAAPDTE